LGYYFRSVDEGSSHFAVVGARGDSLIQNHKG